MPGTGRGRLDPGQRVAAGVLDAIIRIYGTPQTVVSDNRGELTSRVVLE